MRCLLPRCDSILDRLADDLQLSQRCVLTHAVVEERIAIASAVARDVDQCVLDVLEIDAVVFHSTAASARIRS